MKKVSRAGAKLQIQSTPLGMGDEAGGSAGARELLASARSCARP